MNLPHPNATRPTSKIVAWTLGAAVVGVVVAFNGCSRPQDDALARLKSVDTTVLRTEAARLYKQLHATPGPEFTAIKSPAWPPTFQKLKPLRVGCYHDGFAIVLERHGSQETGIHVQPIGMDTQPHGAVTRYERLAEGIYWYQTRD